MSLRAGQRFHVHNILMDPFRLNNLVGDDDFQLHFHTDYSIRHKSRDSLEREQYDAIFKTIFSEVLFVGFFAPRCQTVCRSEKHYIGATNDSIFFYFFFWKRLSNIYRLVFKCPICNNKLICSSKIIDKMNTVDKMVFYFFILEDTFGIHH